jgi:predicted ATP-grasp superfamily ATP-dependent carboligase
VLDPDGLYELLDDQPSDEELGRPVLVHVLSGFVDAGQAGHLAARHLHSIATDRVLARFDIDQLLDYRSRRPSLYFANDHWDSMDSPLLELHLAHDSTGTPFLLLTGPEPDVQWERFVQAVAALTVRYRVRLGVCLQAMPMAVPHTRPIGLTTHAVPSELVEGRPSWGGRVQVPGHVSGLMELRLGNAGLAMAGFVVHVPHYVAQMEYPDAAAVLVEELNKLAGLRLSAEALLSAGRGVRRTIDTQIAEQPEVAAVVSSLERRYDTTSAERDTTGLLRDGAHLPTGEELGAEFERFLAEQWHDPSPAGHDPKPTGDTPDPAGEGTDPAGEGTSPST